MMVPAPESKLTATVWAAMAGPGRLKNHSSEAAAAILSNFMRTPPIERARFLMIAGVNNKGRDRGNHKNYESCGILALEGSVAGRQDQWHPPAVGLAGDRCC